MPRPDFSNYESFSCRCSCQRTRFRRSPVARIMAHCYTATAQTTWPSVSTGSTPYFHIVPVGVYRLFLRVIPFAVTGPATAHAGLLPCGIRPNSRAALVVVGFPRRTDYRVQQWPPSGRNLFAVSRSNPPFPGLAGPIACRVRPSTFPVAPGVVWCPCPACPYNPATRAGNRQHGAKHNASPAGFAAAGVGVGVGVSSGRGCGLRRWWLSFARWQCNRGGLPLQTTLLPRPACPVCAGFVYNQHKPGKSPARCNPAKSDTMKMNY